MIDLNLFNAKNIKRTLKKAEKPTKDKKKYGVGIATVNDIRKYLVKGVKMTSSDLIKSSGYDRSTVFKALNVFEDNKEISRDKPKRSDGVRELIITPL